MGVAIAENPKTIEKWYRNFREKKILYPAESKAQLTAFSGVES
jgi:hypothetical protein